MIYRTFRKLLQHRKHKNFFQVSRPIFQGYTLLFNMWIYVYICKYRLEVKNGRSKLYITPGSQIRTGLCVYTSTLE